MVSSNTTLLTLSPSSYSSYSYSYSYSPLFPFPNTNINTFSPKQLKLNTKNKNKNKNIHSKNNSFQIQCLSTLAFHSQIHEKNQTLSPSLLMHPEFHEIATTADKLKHLSSEFSALSEPIDRVKKLLHYASLLPPLQDSDRVPENRVVGCSTQVWVVSEMDEEGRMRFKADSDSEIGKGYCWCLVWILDGAEPKEVLMVEKEDLSNMNVGLNIKAHSRVNTWQNVLFAMQKATKDMLFNTHQFHIVRSSLY
ncbi:putative Fe-S metabolism associated domain, SufE [Lupinus albus]|uniref:Putative Fe-S metabolism associated domain, SufE n=1 Tax=Lupinus albus TaxID=3870 RepID=A0A6A4Q2E5_LUPAL|nr:putative Fe-S metabolism associated domain, SufE [Lupinus albus]